MEILLLLACGLMLLIVLKRTNAAHDQTARLDKTLSEMALLKQSRLSVTPLTEKQFERLLALAGM